MGRAKSMNSIVTDKNKLSVHIKKELLKNYELYILSLIPLAVLIIFSYLPMYGILIAFKNFIPSEGIWGSPFVGMEHFRRLFAGYNFWRLIKNTLVLSLYSLAAGFPLPIIFAIMLNELKYTKIKKTVQMISYAPHFLSTVVLVSLITVFFGNGGGLVNMLIKKMGGQAIDFQTNIKIFKHLYVWSDVWAGLGWNSIIYISALSGIDPQIGEAAIIDGASRIKRIWHVDIPGILPTAIILLILRCGSIMSIGFDKAFLMQNDLNLEASEIISTYVYKVGIQGAEYSFSTAVGLFNTFINFVLLLSVNKISNKVSETSLW